MTTDGATDGAITCRLAAGDDKATVAELFYRCDRHYWGGAAPSREAMAAHIEARVMAEGASVEVLLAEDGGAAIGFATFAVLYPAPDCGGQLFLKDLFVVKEARSRGAGLVLMRGLAKLAVQRGCVRFDWTTEDHNPRAMAFYERIGARRVTEKVYYRFDDDALRAFADGD